MDPSDDSMYDDGGIACRADHLLIRRYYFPWGDKRIPYTSIRSVTEQPLTEVSGRYRIWGSGDLVHWWNLDTRRPQKAMALVLDVGRRVRPTISPDDPAAVERILSARVPPRP